MSITDDFYIAKGYNQRDFMYAKLFVGSEMYAIN